MNTYIYFFFTMAAFTVFMSLPLLLIKPWKNPNVLNNLINEHDLRKMFTLKNSNDKFFLHIKRLSGATKVEKLKLKNQNFFELKFQSLNDSVNFKKAVIQAGLCMETHITIIRENQEFMVIFFTS